MIDIIARNTEHSQFDYDFQRFIIPEKSDFMNNKQKSNKSEMKKKIYWKEKYISELRKLSNKYLTDSEIAKQLVNKFKDRFTAMSVKRKRHRLKLIKIPKKLLSYNSFHVKINKKSYSKGYTPQFFPLKLIQRYDIKPGNHVLLKINSRIFTSKIIRKERTDRPNDNYFFYTPYSLVQENGYEKILFIKKIENIERGNIANANKINSLALLKQINNILVCKDIKNKNILASTLRSSVPLSLPKNIMITKELIRSLGFFQGEGSKLTSRRIELVNSDPNLIKMFMKTVETSFKLRNPDWKVALRYTANSKNQQIEDKYMDFWSYQIGIPKEKFCKPQCFIGNPKAESGSVQIYIPGLVLREVWIALLKLSYHLIKENKEYAKWFIQGVLAADGCPVFHKGKLKDIMIRIENEKEGKIYMGALRTIGINAYHYPKRRAIRFITISEIKKAYDLELFKLHRQRHKKFVRGFKERFD